MSAHERLPVQRVRSPEEIQLDLIRRQLTYICFVLTIFVAVLAGAAFYGAYYVWTAASSIQQQDIHP
jgi:hypothetical protein